MIGRDARINLLISTGHFLSHFYQLCLPPLFLVWQRQFDISFAELGLSVVLMTGTAAVLQTPVGFLVDRYGARPFLIGGALVMSLAIALMAFATAFWQILVLALISGIGNAVFHPCDYAILAGSIRKERMGRSFALHGFSGNIGFALAPPTIAALLSVMDWRSVPAGGGRSRPAGGRCRHRPEPHPARPGAQGHARARHVDARAAARPHPWPVLPVLFPRRHGERRRNGLADHRAARGERARPCARLGRAHRLYGRERRRRPARRMGGRQIDPLSRLLRRRPDQLLRGGDSGRQSRADGRPCHHRADARSPASRSAPAGRRAM